LIIVHYFINYSYLLIMSHIHYLPPINYFMIAFDIQAVAILIGQFII